MTSLQQRRPLSPHLQIYKIQITSLLSILHRATGMILFGGVFMWTLYFFALASGSAFYQQVQDLLLHPLGLCSLGLWSFALCYHFFNGIRHLFWDMGFGYEMKTVRLTGWLVITSSFLASGFLMLFILFEVF